MEDFNFASATYKAPPAKPVGFLLLPYGFGQSFCVQGGPFDAFPLDSEDNVNYGVCLEVHSDMYEFADLVLDIPDFSIPTPAELDNTCAKIIDAMFDGKMVYVGCMAGRGRTGLVLSCLAKAFGIAGPVEYVRKHYYKGAVETASQYAFVTGVPMPKTAKRLRINRFKYLFKKIGA